MAANETREPTLAEVIEEVRKSKLETIKTIEGSRISIWVTILAIGGSVTFFGLSYLTRLINGTWNIVSSSIFIAAVGLVVVELARRGAKRAEEGFRNNWHEEPPKF
jgi:uncharacterized membrane protein YjjP (DUF1212 family)